MARLLVLQSVWGLVGCPGFDVENDLDAGLERVVAAGFDGVGVNIARVARTAGVARAMNPRGLAWEGQVLVRDADQLAGYIAEAHRLGAHHLNVQVAMRAPQHSGWLDQHIAWWRRGFEHWLAQAGADDALTFMCELGPPPYAITAPDGSELTNRWDEAQRMRDIVRGLWSEVSGAPQ